VLDDYLNWMASPNAATVPGIAVSIDLAPFSAGFAGASYEVSGASGGTVALDADGHSAVFTPTSGFSGLAGFDFTIVGGGTTVTRRIGVVVTDQSVFERRWRGGAGNTWDGTSENWLNGSTVTAFQPGNTIVFDDTGAANSSITLAGVLQPSSIAISGATNYTFIGSGTLSGAISLTKTGSGTLSVGGGHSVGSVLVDGGTLAIGSGTFTANGNVTNNGTIRLTGGAALNVTGTFVNNGVLDIMTGAQVLPLNLINNGTVLDSTRVRVRSATKSGADFTVMIDGYAGHSYGFQRADSLAGPWTPVGAPQPGSGSVLMFNDIGGATGGQKFYRVVLSP
jgi:hypothetical protein